MNSRFLHPTKTYKDESGKVLHEALTTCSYHTKECCGEHPPDQPQKILIPNTEALCTECYMDKMNGEKPQMCILEKAPGVSSVSAMKNLKSKLDIALTKKKTIEEELTDDSVCCWKAVGIEAETFLRAYKCTNKVFRDPETKILYSTCAMHIKRCIRKHETEATSVIAIPNIHGLCTMHHMAEHKDEPIEVPLPYPGMIKKLFKREQIPFKTGHWAAPNWAPPHDIELIDFPDIEDEDIIQIFFAFIARTKRTL